MERRYNGEQYQMKNEKGGFFTETASTRKVVQYELDFDRQKARELRERIYEAPDVYQSERAQFEGYMKMQLLTALGERFNRGISEYSYFLKDGKLRGEHSDEPFEDILIRGRDYRKENGNALDHPREAAEVEGFQRMQEIMADDTTPVGEVVISVSPPGREGSIYKHNFYDMFQKADDGSVKAVRFSSALTPIETIERLFEIAPHTSYPDTITDTALLAHPIRLGKDLSMEKVHKLLHRYHEVLSEDDFAEMKRVCDVLMTSFIASLIDNPEDTHSHALRFNAVLNGADEVADLLKLKREGVIFEDKKAYDNEDIYSLGMRAVRSVDTGCGLSGGVGLSGGFSLGFGYFGIEQFSMRPENDPNLCRCGGAAPHFHCPGTKVIKEKDKSGNEVKKRKECSYKIIVGQGITVCPDCGEAKKC